MACGREGAEIDLHEEKILTMCSGSGRWVNPAGEEKARRLIMCVVVVVCRCVSKPRVCKREIKKTDGLMPSEAVGQVGGLRERRKRDERNQHARTCSGSGNL